ncbi:MAG: hypothetical protein CME70_10155 [Halobacteriovorax sp.]|nr:hypothetical protein [Halobacteriovorax sp.]|tara:strand:- start:42061 stop:42279 length:219 start_codon:yes stop_codon:yes gene_type:complete
MKTMKNFLTLGLFAAMPVLILLAVQVSPANTDANVYEMPKVEKRIVTIEDELKVILSKTDNISSYTMKDEGF